MATTTNGIYYPNDYESAADIPADMKKLAESVDTKISENKTEINNIKTEQTTQNTNISNLQKDNTTNKQDITNIKAKDTEQDKYIAELEAENARLREDLNGLPKGQASGESIDLSDSAEMRCDLKISGNSKQETRSGKNKLEFINGTYTDKNVTAVVKDGVITLNGNPSSTSFVVIDEDFNYTFKANQRYTISLNNSNIINSDEAKFRFSNGITIIKDINFNSANKKETFYFTEDTLASNITIRTGTAITYNNFVIKPQLELGSTATEWEQGGASPSPDYPSEVECCGDNINFFDKDNANILDGCYINESKKIISSNAQSKTLYIEIQPNTTYTIQKVLSSRFAVGTFVDTPAVNVPLTNFLQDNSKTKITITSGENDNYLAVFYYHSNYDTTIKPQEILNSIKIENGQGCINEVICNKNILNKDKLDKTYFSIDSNDNITSLVADNRTFTNIEAIANVIEGKKYTLSCENIVTGSIQIAYTLDNIVIDRQYNTKKISFTAPKTGSIAFKILNVTYPYVLGKIQIEEGIETTDYIEHKSQTYTIPTQQPIRSIEIAKNTFLRDTFIKKNNKWYERHWIPRIIFDGTENWKIANTGMSNQYCYLIIGTGLMIANSFICTHYTKEEMSTTTGQIRIKTELSLDDWKSYLAEQYTNGTPVYVDYLQAEPIDIECTEEQSTILFDIEQNAKTYDKVTHMYSTDNVSSYKDVTYKKDLDTMITNIEQAILSQGGNI